MKCRVPNHIVSDSALMSALGRHMNRAVQRQAVAAGNVANAETPGYHAQEIKFADTLADHLSAQGPRTTHARHIGGASPDHGEVREATGLHERRDGNNVQMEREMLDLTRAGTDFATAQTVLAAKFRLVRYAINEGR